MKTHETHTPKNAATTAIEAIEALFATCLDDDMHRVALNLRDYITSWVKLQEAENELIRLAIAGKQRQEDWDVAYEAGMFDGKQRALAELGAQKERTA